LTVIVEILKKSDDGVKSSGTLLEIPIWRSSLFIREATPSKNSEIGHYPRLKDFKGLQKLPSVEMVSRNN